jgi:hypothetical protein
MDPQTSLADSEPTIQNSVVRILGEVDMDLADYNSAEVDMAVIFSAMLMPLWIIRTLNGFSYNMC